MTPEKLIEIGFEDSNHLITDLIKATSHPEKYLFEGEDINNTQLSMCNVLKCTTCTKLTKEELQTLNNFRGEVIKEVSNMSDENQIQAVKILDRLENSKSTELRRIKTEMALQIFEKKPEEYEKACELIEKI